MMLLWERAGYRFGMWLVDRIPERMVAWLASKARVRRWATRG